MVRDACRACYWGPNGTKQCEIRSLPPSMRGESCAFWDMARRYGVRSCGSCEFNAGSICTLGGVKDPKSTYFCFRWSEDYER